MLRDRSAWTVWGGGSSSWTTSGRSPTRVAALLLNEGFDILLAHDGEEAVATAILERPDLILMDYQMPRLDGVQAAVRIRKTLPKGQCRILLATAALMDLSAVKEADGFLLKPYSKEILLSFIHALI